ncbi:MAG: carboxypeptidase-like regulatory domain-containing protein [Flavobacterium sp.]|uniref:carboxypeptidase-like regulatory domain-containing protein n=1 Tax=Flavobacterium sp. TaxID=239 RepID=UPI003265B0BF
MTKINISIPQPCHENWQAMTQADKGRFCDSCQKKVFDFTSSSDREIINAFEKNNNLCGRFLNTQLDRDLVKPKEKSTLWLATTTALISLLSINEAVAQGEVKVEQTDRRVLGKFIATPLKEEIEVSGIVSDKTGPLPGAIVSIKGTSTKVQTDIDGKYAIKAHIGDTLIVSFVGLTDMEYQIKDSRKNNFDLKMNIPIQMLEGTLGAISVKKRTFFGRLFHKSKYKY